MQNIVVYHIIHGHMNQCNQVLYTMQPVWFGALVFLSTFNKNAQVFRHIQL